MNLRIILILTLCLAALWTFSQPFSKNCEASFTYQQDPANHLIVNFTSTSTGDITDYLWDFGDGSTFSGENPSHAFPFTGDFTVCLKVSSDDTLNLCSDSICVAISINLLSQYNIGGLLFAGMYPINNPQPSGDHAFAYLYKFGPGGLAPVDSVYFDTLGYFWFEGVTEGKYFIKTGLLESSSHFSQFLPAYHGDCLRWTDADTLFVNQNVYNINIYMVKGTPLTTGGGHIRGNLLMEQSAGGTIPMENGQVVLADATGIPYQCTYSDQSGGFLFDLVPAGEYQVFSEYTARFSQKVDLVLDNNSPSADSLELKIYAAISGVEDLPLTAPVNVTLFPNPVETALKIQLTLNQPEEIDAQIYNHMGKLIKTASWHFPAGRFQMDVNVGDLTPAMYLITMKDSHSAWQITKKFVKK